jgi:hypothetical protein
MARGLDVMQQARMSDARIPENLSGASRHVFTYRPDVASFGTEGKSASVLQLWV